MHIWQRTIIRTWIALQNPLLPGMLQYFKIKSIATATCNFTGFAGYSVLITYLMLM